MVEDDPDKREYNQDELDLIARLKWCKENPDKIVWVDADFILDEHAI